MVFLRKKAKEVVFEEGFTIICRCEGKWADDLVKIRKLGFKKTCFDTNLPGCLVLVGCVAEEKIVEVFSPDDGYSVKLVQSVDQLPFIPTGLSATIKEEPLKAAA